MFYALLSHRTRASRRDVDCVYVGLVIMFTRCHVVMFTRRHSLRNTDVRAKGSCNQEKEGFVIVLHQFDGTPPSLEMCTYYTFHKVRYAQRDSIASSIAE